MSERRLLDNQQALTTRCLSHSASAEDRELIQMRAVAWTISIIDMTDDEIAIFAALDDDRPQYRDRKPIGPVGWFVLLLVVLVVVGSILSR